MSTAESAPAAPAASAKAPAIMRAESMSKEFGGLVAVKDVSIAIPERSIVSIIGPNGAGKTTLFNMLTGLYKPTTGRIYFRDSDITSRRPDVIPTCTWEPALGQGS